MQNLSDNAFDFPFGTLEGEPDSDRKEMGSNVWSQGEGEIHIIIAGEEYLLEVVKLAGVVVGFRLISPRGDRYEVARSYGNLACNCKGFTFCRADKKTEHGQGKTCKHVVALKKLHV